jgi:hypothetical protein
MRGAHGDLVDGGIEQGKKVEVAYSSGEMEAADRS